jgi:hypothetical protein
MPRRINAEAAQVVGHADAIKGTAAAIAKNVLEFDAEHTGQAHWQSVLSDIAQIQDQLKQMSVIALAEEGRCAQLALALARDKTR